MTEKVLPKSLTRRRLILSILKFIQMETEAVVSPEKKESLEVALQCLQSAYGLSTDSDVTYEEAEDLLSLFVTAEQKMEQDMNLAEGYKTRGNDYMRKGDHQIALEMYNRAIELNPRNAVYFCNRAAAYSRLENHKSAIDDCHQAVILDPTYSKAYGRLGVAYCNLRMFKEARDAYHTALQLDPSNTTYEDNLRLADEHYALTGSSTQPPSQPPAPPNVHIDQFMSNPDLINLATQMLNDASVRNVMTGLLHMGNEGGGNPNMDSLMQMGQQLAEQMQTNNPQFIDNLRRQFEQQGSSEQNPGESQTKPDDKQPEK